jgi:hypothetical protein
MQVVVSIALVLLYVGISLTLGGAHPKSGFIWWFFVPITVTFCAGIIAKGVMAILPLPRSDARLYGRSPRLVRLSWRAAVRLPVLAPAMLLPWYMFDILNRHFDIDWVLWIAGVLALAASTRVVLKSRRELRLLRYGEVVTAFIDSRELDVEWASRITYHFVTAGGETISGRRMCTGYDVSEASGVPVFYDPDNPADHIAACASWFEVA